MITLYEFPSNLPNQTPVSQHTALVRAVLNYRRIPFQSEFISPRHLETLAQYLGATSTSTHPNGQPKYTVPIIVDDSFPASSTDRPQSDASADVGSDDEVEAEGGSGREFLALSGSYAIVRHIERAYPDLERPLFPAPSSSASTPTETTFSSSIINDTPEFLPFLDKLFSLLIDPLAPLYAPPEDEEYWANSLANRSAITSEGCSPDPNDIPAPTPKPGSEEFDKVVKEAKEGLRPTVERLWTKQAAPWLSGPRPKYQDFVLIGYLWTMEKCAPAIYESLVEGEGEVLGGMLENGRLWLRFERTKPSWELN